MNTTFTPGPWSVTENSWEVSTVYSASGEVARCYVSGCVTEEDQAPPEAVKDANAQLIAAAPDLYTALKNLLQDTQHAEHEDCDSGPCPVREARAAIAKAEGRA